MAMKCSRRTALSILGLASASSGIAVEHALADNASSEHGVITGNDYDGRKFSAALRHLADEIDRGAVVAQKLNVSTDLTRDQIVVQHLTLDFLIHDQEAI